MLSLGCRQKPLFKVNSPSLSLSCSFSPSLYVCLFVCLSLCLFLSHALFLMPSLSWSLSLFISLPVSHQIFFLKMPLYFYIRFRDCLLCDGVSRVHNMLCKALESLNED